MSTLTLRPLNFWDDTQGWTSAAGAVDGTSLQRSVADGSDNTYLKNDLATAAGTHIGIRFRLAVSTVLTVASTLGGSTLTVASTEGFQSSGSVLLGPDSVTYTGKTATTFTGCTGSTVKAIGIEVIQNASTGLPLPATAQIRSVRPWMRILESSGTSVLKLRLVDLVTDDWASETSYSPSNVIVDKAGVVSANHPTGAAWTPALLYQTAVSVGSGSAPQDHFVFRLWADVVVNYAPVAVVSMLNLNLTSQPTVSFTYTDPEGNALERSHVRVFSSAQYGAGGFDPATSTATADSGARVSSSLTWQVSTALPNGTYRAYVKVADAGSGGRYGDWAFVQFTSTVTPPAAPTITAVADPTNARVTLAIPGRADLTVTLTAQRSTDSGATWTDVYGGVALPTVTTGQTLTFYDYACPPNTPAVYRATATTTTGGFSLTSAASANTAAVTVVSTVFRLKDPDAPADNIIISVFGDAPISKDIDETQGVFTAIGREFPIVLSGGLKAPKVQAITFQTFNEAQWLALKKLRDRCKTLLLQDNMTGSAYVRLGPQFTPAVQLTADRVANPLRRIPTSYLEVAPPVSP